MRLESAPSLKQQFLNHVIEPMAAVARRLPVTPARAARLRTITGGVGPGSVFGVETRPLELLLRCNGPSRWASPRGKGEYRLAIRVQRQGLRHSPLVELTSPLG